MIMLSGFPVRTQCRLATFIYYKKTLVDAQSMRQLQDHPLTYNGTLYFIKLVERIPQEHNKWDAFEWMLNGWG